MGNPLLLLWSRIFGDQDEPDGRRPESPPVPEVVPDQPSVGVLLVLRRMRAPLIVLILAFAISVLGLSLMPGRDASGHRVDLTIFESFYVMAYTATTIGFGEIPRSFTPEQRMWVTLAIFLSVIAWAYAIGSLLALTQDRAFRRALARRHFVRKVTALQEPFMVLIGYGNASRKLARSLDGMGRRFVVIERDENRVAAVDLDNYRADAPALLGDARDTGRLAMAGVGHPRCEGVLALTSSDEVNLDVTMTTLLLRPDLPVVCRASSRTMARRMATFGNPDVVNPLDRFGDHLRILLRSPAAYQLMIWLTSAPGTPLPERRAPLPRGRWVLLGSGRLERELLQDLRAEGIDVCAVHVRGSGEELQGEDGAVAAAEVDGASAVVVATDNDMTNLWLVEAARRRNPDVFVACLQNRPANAELFRAVDIDFGMVPSDLIAHEVLARIATPSLMRFLPEVPRQGDAWAQDMVGRLARRCGTGTPDLWVVELGPAQAPAVVPALAERERRLGDLLRSPRERDVPLDVVVLALLRDGDTVVAPGDDHLLWMGDRLLLAGRRSTRRELDVTLTHEPTAAYVLEGRNVASGWLWRKLTGTDPKRPSQRA